MLNYYGSKEKVSFPLNALYTTVGISKQVVSQYASWPLIIHNS